MSGDKLSLPDPGKGRFWEVTSAGEWLTLRLMQDGGGAGDYYTSDPRQIVAKDMRAAQASARALTVLAEQMLEAQDRANEFVGVYRTTEETN